MTQLWDGHSETFVAALQKNARNQIHVYLKEYEGLPIIDMRVWYEDKQTGQWKPSPKGIAIQTELYPAFAEAVRKIGEYLGDD
jgi:hypothetical protein